MLRKISKNFIMQEAFQETMLRNDIYQAKETQRKPYLCDFLLLEYLDSIWINEVYRPHRLNLMRVLADVLQEVHSLEHFEELEEKKEILRKIVNIIHQTEFTLKSNADFLSISQVNVQLTAAIEDSTNILDQISSSSIVVGGG